MVDRLLGALNYTEWVIAHDDLWGFSNERNSEQLLHSAVALAEEAIEVLDAAVMERNPEHVAEECVDVVIYMQKLLTQFDRTWDDLSKYPAIELHIPNDYWDEIHGLVRLVGETVGKVKKMHRGWQENAAEYHTDAVVIEMIMNLLRNIVQSIFRIFSKGWADPFPLNNPRDPSIARDNDAVTYTAFDYAWVKKFVILGERWNDGLSATTVKIPEHILQEYDDLRSR